MTKVIFLVESDVLYPAADPAGKLVPESYCSAGLVSWRWATDKLPGGSVVLGIVEDGGEFVSTGVELPGMYLMDYGEHWSGNTELEEYANDIVEESFYDTMTGLRYTPAREWHYTSVKQWPRMGSLPTACLFSGKWQADSAEPRSTLRRAVNRWRAELTQQLLEELLAWEKTQCTKN